MYRDMISKMNQWLAFGIVCVSVVSYYLIDKDDVMSLIVSCSLLVYAIKKDGGVLENRVTKFFSGISMEIYLSHMMVFRVLEKLRINTAFGNGLLQYAITSVFVLAGATVFSVVMQMIIGKVMEALNKRL